MDLSIDKKDIFCINCGKNGHISKKCLCPIISIGIICLRFNNYNIDLNNIIHISKKLQNNCNFTLDETIKLQQLKLLLNSNFNIDNEVQYLLVRRRNSLNYVEFIRGKYDINNLDYLIKNFNLITIPEKQYILNNDFSVIWNDLWGTNSNNDSHEYKESKEKFDLLKKGYLIKKNDINFEISLDKLINDVTYQYNEPEWGFPKGRRNSKEKNIECAKREFEEETNINENEVNIVNMTPFEETYIASNGLKYRHIYYISQVKDNKNINLNINSTDQHFEIGNIDWFNYHDGLAIIREYNIEKKNILLTLHYNIKYLLDNLKQILNNVLD